MKYFVPFLAALIVPFSAFAEPVFDVPPQIEIINYEPPSVMKADGTFYLAYELHLTNFGDAPQKLVAIDVLDASPAARTIARFNESRTSRTMVLDMISPPFILLRCSPN